MTSNKRETRLLVKRGTKNSAQTINLRKLKPAPTNLGFVKRKSVYEKELPAALDPLIKDEQEFWLETVFPKLLASYNGGLDALEILDTVLDKRSDFGGYLRLKAEAVELGSKLLIINKVSKDLNLPKSDVHLLKFALVAPKEITLTDLLKGVGPAPAPTENAFTGKARKNV